MKDHSFSEYAYLQTDLAVRGTRVFWNTRILKLFLIIAIISETFGCSKVAVADACAFIHMLRSTTAHTINDRLGEAGVGTWLDEAGNRSRKQHNKAYKDKLGQSKHSRFTRSTTAWTMQALILL